MKSAMQTVITPRKKALEIPLGEIFGAGDLLYHLVLRDIKIRYKQTLLGAAWAALQPLATMMIFTVIFGRLARLPSEGYPYTVFTLAALIPWQLFASAFAQTTESVVANEALITKVYLPRLLIPLAPVIAGMVEFVIATALLAVLLLGYGIQPGFSLALLPAFLLLAAVSALGIGLWFTALNVRYRDVKYTVPFMVQIWFYLTPVAYSATLVPVGWQPLYWLNPMVGVVEGFRWMFLNRPCATPHLFLLSVAVAAVLLLSGILYFQRVESEFADII